MNYRIKREVNIIRFPQGFAEEFRGFKDCCKPIKVLGDESDPENYKNDKKGVYVKISDPADLVTFRIEKCGVAGFLTNLGDVAVFPQDDLAVGFIYDWRQYLIANGPGRYTIKVEFTISGVTGGYTWGEYDLLPYSIANARDSIRLWGEFNSFYQKKEVDFTGSNFVDSIRCNGFFGNKQPDTQIENLITKGRIVEKTTRENLNKYELRTDWVPICITREIIDFFLVNEDVLLISDHNRTNHDYLLFDVPVVLEETAEMEYVEGNRNAALTATFGDRKKLDKSYYNVQ